MLYHSSVNIYIITHLSHHPFSCKYCFTIGAVTVWNHSMCLSKLNNELYDNLSRPLNLEELSPTLWNDKCDYIDPYHVKT